MASETIIRPTTGKFGFNLRELWDFRELFLVLVWRDIKVRYRQTVLGIAWAILQPLTVVGIFSIFFGKIVGLSSDSLPYPLFVLIGVTIWNFFAGAVASASHSLVANESLLRKVYFPRLIIPVSCVAVALVDFSLVLVFLFLTVFFLGLRPGLWTIPFGVVIFLTLLLTTLGTGFFLATMNVKFRDVRYLLNFFLQIGMFLLPVVYPLSVVYDWRRWALVLNPLTSVIENTRRLILNTSIDGQLLLIGLTGSLVVFGFGFWYFLRSESYFSDYL